MKLCLMIAVLGFIALPVDAASVDEAAQEVVGGWKLEFTTPDGEYRTPYVVVGRQHQEFVAWYVTDGEREAFSKVKLDGEELRLTISPKEFGGDIKATVVAHLSESNACAGTIEYAEKYGDSGEFEFKGKRMDVSELENVETWKIGFVDPDGKRHDARVTVISMGEGFIGWYSSDDYELPAKKMTVTGDQVVMSVSTKTEDGEKIDVTFRGEVNGERVTGEVNWSLGGESGTLPFSGKRAS